MKKQHTSLDDYCRELNSFITRLTTYEDDSVIGDIETTIDAAFDLLSKYRLEKFRRAYFDFSNFFHSQNEVAAVFLLRKIQQEYFLSEESIKEKGSLANSISSSKFDDNPQFLSFLEALFSEKNVRIGFPKKYKIHKNQHTIFLQKLTTQINSIINNQKAQESNENEVLLVRLLAGLRQVSQSANKYDEFYFCFSIFINYLSTINQFFQKARDFSEEAILCSHRDNMEFYGFFVKFSMYQTQKNTVDSLIFGILLFKSLKNACGIPLEIKSSIDFSMFCFFRDHNLSNAANTIYTRETTKEINEHTRQQYFMGHLNMLLLSGNLDLIQETEEYIKKKEDDIIDDGFIAQNTWNFFLENVERIFPAAYNDSITIKKFKTRLLSMFPPEHLKKLRLGTDSFDEVKNKFKRKLSKLLPTRNSVDIIHETQFIAYAAVELIEKSILNEDAEGILLGHLANSIISNFNVAAEELNTDGLIAYKNHDDNLNFINDYTQYVNLRLDSIKTTHIWIGLTNQCIYMVQLTKGKFSVQIVNAMTYKEIKKWVDEKMRLFSFDHCPKTNEFFGAEFFWGEEERLIENEMPCINIESPVEKNVIIYPDKKFRIFPISLLRINGVYSSLMHSVSVSLDPAAYLNYQRSITANKRQIKIWAPTKLQDGAVSNAFQKTIDKVKKFNPALEEDIFPGNNTNEDINIYIAHGNKKLTLGFVGIHPNDNSVYTDSNRIFGSGKIAILFICHAGSIDGNIFSGGTKSLVTKLLNFGYDAVIAPSWSLNIEIPGVWLHDFLDNIINNNFSISEAFCSANNTVKEKYISPAAWGALQLFGNPHINFV